MDWSVFILNDRRQSDLPGPFFFLLSKNFSESCRKKRSNEIAFVTTSQQPRSLTSRYCDRSQDRDELTAQEDPQSSSTTRHGAGCSEPAIREGWKVKSYGSCSAHLPVTSHPSASPTPVDPASQLLCEVGNYRSLPCRRRK